MRTTLDLDDDLLALARVRAKDQGISLGAAVSDLMRRGLKAINVHSSTVSRWFSLLRVPR